MNHNSTKLLILFFFLVGISSCRTEEQKLISQIEGSWRLLDIYLTGHTVEDPSLPESGTITFQNCKIGKNNIGFCEGSQQFNDGTVTAFQYQPGNIGEELEAFNILPLQSMERSGFYLEGHYQITKLGRDEVTFEGNIYIVNEAGESESYSATFVLEKK